MGENNVMASKAEPECIAGRLIACGGMQLEAELSRTLLYRRSLRDPEVEAFLSCLNRFFVRIE